MHLAVSAFTGRVGYIHRKFLPPFLRVDELCQPPHEPVAQAADERGIRHGFAHPLLLVGHRVTRAVRREAPAQRGATAAPGLSAPTADPGPAAPAHHSRLRAPLHPAAGGGGHPESPHGSPSLPGRDTRDAPRPRAPLPIGRSRRNTSPPPLQLPLKGGGAQPPGPLTSPVR